MNATRRSLQRRKSLPEGTNMEEPVMNTGSTVLYVNDNPKSLRLLASILKDWRFE